LVFGSSELLIRANFSRSRKSTCCWRKNITNALELYTHDASALFAFLTTSAEQERWPRCAAALAEALDFQHFAIIDSSGVLKKSLYPTEEDEAILPLGGFSPLKRLLSEGGR